LPALPQLQLHRRRRSRRHPSRRPHRRSRLRARHPTPPSSHRRTTVTDTLDLDPHYDAIVVGARPAGAATAMLLARAGLRVAVLERSAANTDTVSTHALMRGGVLQLARWRLLDRVVAAGTPPVRTTVYRYGGERRVI